MFHGLIQFLLRFSNKPKIKDIKEKLNLRSAVFFSDRRLGKTSFP